MVETLHNKAIEENADVVVSDFILEKKSESTYLSDIIPPEKEILIKNLIAQINSFPSVCNKLIKRTLYLHDDCLFPIELNYGEDRHVMIRLYFHAKKIVKVNKAFYHYVYNPESMSKSKNNMHFENILQFWNLLDSFLTTNKLYEKYKQDIDCSKVQNKATLMIETRSSQLRRKYANIYANEEKNNQSHLKMGEKIMLQLVHYKCYNLAQLFHHLLILKNKKR
jgi:hypothetical protein